MFVHILLLIICNFNCLYGDNQCSIQSPSSSADCSSENRQSFVTRYANCSLLPECGEGPYFINEEILKKDLVEDRKGRPLHLKLNLVDYRTCSPISGAKIYIWQPDYAGIYSGFMDKPPVRRQIMKPRDDRRFLRGTQISNSNGTVEFDTLFPGHYPGRTPHIHFRVHLNDSVSHIGQIFFDEQIISFVNSQLPYNSVSSRRLCNEDDGEFNYFNGKKSIIQLQPAHQLSGTMNIVINPLHKSQLMWP